MLPMRVLGFRRRLLFLLISVAFLYLSTHLFLTSKTARFSPLLAELPLPKWAKPYEDTLKNTGLTGTYQPIDRHPISLLIAQADEAWQELEDDRSKSFREVVAKYRQRYGRNPPPRFDDWYKFARQRSAYDLDDFEQIMDDMRPFWGVSAAKIRALAARMWEDDGNGVANIHIRSGKVVAVNRPGWRVDTMAAMLDSFVKFLPDMDIAMNALDQPRVTVPWSDLQGLLASEARGRNLESTARNEFSSGMSGFTELGTAPKDEPPEDAGWVMAPAKQYMDIAKKACPPASHANGGISSAEAERAWKSHRGGVVTNFNTSSDLCAMGSDIQNMHGFLFTSSSLLNTERLVPIFGECKVNVNNDILFPANMYWREDERYKYNSRYDVNWQEKTDRVIWRGVTSGGVQTAQTWSTMHRHRLVMALNATVQANNTDVRIMVEKPEAVGQYENFQAYNPADFLDKFSDVGFTDLYGCVPDGCGFLSGAFETKPQTSLSEQFLSRYLVDVDGHSFSGRWRAFLQSKALGIKATIFREWHDSRLLPWRHFVPMDNRFDDIHTILTYFIGIGEQDPKRRQPGEPFVQRHDLEGKRLALQGREWASKVLRSEDIEVYMFRLLLEYGRVIDDNRARIGYGGDGSELDDFDRSFPIE